MLDRHGDIALHEISIRQLGDRDALPVAIFGHEQRPELVGHIILHQRGARPERRPKSGLQEITRELLLKFGEVT